MIKVTGSNGFIGSLLCKRLSVPKCNQYDILDAKDICNDQVQDECVAGATVIIHLAAISGLRECMKDETEARRINSEATIKLYNKAKKSNVKRFVFASSSAVYGEAEQYVMDEHHPCNPRSIYGQTKYNAELGLMSATECHLNAIIARKSNVYGWGVAWKGITVIDAFIGHYIENSPITIQGDGSQKRDFVHVADIVNLYSYLANIDNRVRPGIYNVGGNDCISIRSLAETVNDIGESILGYRVPIVMKKDISGAMTSHDFRYDYSRIRCETKYSPIFNIGYYVRERLLNEIRK